MKGSLALASEPGKGSVFTLEARLPVVEEEAQALVERAEAPSRGARPLNILIAEDNELNRDLLHEILEMNGMTVSEAHDGLEAVDAFAASEPGAFDLILMDMNMPNLDGVEASRRIRGLARPDAGTIPIFACTANSFEEDRERCMAAGMTGFLAKPIDFPELIGLLREMGGSKGVEDGAKKKADATPA